MHADMSAIPQSVVEAAACLAGQTPDVLQPAAQGGNGRIYRLVCGRAVYALKQYPSPTTADPRDRLKTEARALQFLAGHGYAHVPRLLASDAGRGFSLFEWIDGDPVIGPSADDLAAITGLVQACHALRTAPDAADLPLGSEACPSLDELLRQIGVRQQRLLAVAAEPDLARFLAGEFDKALTRFRAAAMAVYERAGLDWQAELALHHRTLSPSDFGFHNALRRPDGRLAFLDFEYFGWDDPVKLVADFVLHPGMAMQDALRQDFLRDSAALFRADPSFTKRFSACRPLYALRWALIILNAFLPQHRAARGHLDRQSWEAYQARQLQKARAFLGRHMTMDSVDYE